MTSRWHQLSVLTRGPGASETEKEKKGARAYRFVLGGLVGPVLRAREGEGRGGFGGLGQKRAWLVFF